ncbi:MAG TPA: 3-dehydroquinate synthase [Candidatus Acidoferrum sp.]
MKTGNSQAVGVRASSGCYDVLCRSGLLGRVGREVSRLGKFSSVHVVSSSKVWRAVGRKIQKSFARGSKAPVHLFDDAEAAKNLRTVEGIARKLVVAGADRQSLIVAVGGGVVGDVAGFVSASYLRGVALVHVPTTLVAQVDSAIGGKTGVNLPEGKNLVGAFYPPRLVLVDPEALKSLPDREFRGGLAEVIKYGVIADPELFAFLESNMEAILGREAKALEKIIRRSIEIKAQVVSKDERESGLREILNYGHTFGHALESTTRYKRFQHGEAVAWGMMCAALLGHEAVGTRADAASRIVALVRKIGPLPGWPKIAPRVLMAAMQSDKKTRAGHVRFVLAPRIGHAASFDDVRPETVMCILRFAPHFLVRPLQLTGKCDG